MQSSSIIVFILAVALVAASVYVGSQVFRRNSVEASRDAIASELKDLAVASLKHYNRPTFMGGGNHSFMNLDKIRRHNTKARGKNGTNGKGKGVSGTQVWETEAGIYYVVIAERDSAVIQAYGDEIGQDKVNPVTLQLIVKKDSRKIKILN